MRAIRMIVGLGLLMATTAVVQADETAAQSRAAAPAHEPVPPAARAVESGLRSPPGKAKFTRVPASSDNVICLQSSIRCFSTKAPAAGTPRSSAPALDLRAPELNRVFSQAELSQKLQDPDEQYEITETVQVEGARQLTPVSVGLMAIPWAIIHPTQAWRILMPVQDAK
jgi:hypothetical protein